MAAQAVTEMDWAPRATLALSIGVSALLWGAFLIAIPGRSSLAPAPGWTQSEARDALQGALVDAAPKDAPALVTAQDRHWLKADQASLTDVACEDRGQAAALDAAPGADCALGRPGSD